MSAPGKTGAHGAQLGDVCDGLKDFKIWSLLFLHPARENISWSIKPSHRKYWRSQNLFLLINELHKSLSPAVQCAILVLARRNEAGAGAERAATITRGLQSLFYKG